MNNNFLLRTLSGIIFAGLILIASANNWIFAVVFLAFMLISQKEFYQLARLKDSEPQQVIGFMVSAFAFLYVSPLAKHFDYASFLFLLPAALLLLLIPIIELFRKKEQPLQNIASTYMGIIYVGMPFVLAMLFQVFTNDSYSFAGWGMMLPIFILIWSSDVFAYLSGMLLGKHKLFERISPKKTWEGSIGGLILTLVFAYLLSLYFDDLSTGLWLIIGVLVVVFGTLGDLIESMFKRSVGVKDSGNIMPGHGGLLDRFDSFLLVVPAVFVFVLASVFLFF